MPLKFWKKEKEEKPKEKDKATAPEEVPEAKGEPEAVPERPSAAPPAPAPDAKPAPARGGIDEIHAGLVDLGLTVPATKAVFEKRIDGFDGGRDAFLTLYGTEPYRAVTKVLVEWLAIRAMPEFDPEKLLAEVNLRLSSFGLAIELTGLAWLDEELGLRKCRLRLGDQEKVVRFKDPRDFLKGVNDLLGPRKIVFIELETWGEDLAFLLVREPRWPALAETELVVVKDPHTASDGECGECGARLGKYWHDCLSCGAVFG